MPAVTRTVVILVFLSEVPLLYRTGPLTHQSTTQGFLVSAFYTLTEVQMSKCDPQIFSIFFSCQISTIANLLESILFQNIFNISKFFEFCITAPLDRCDFYLIILGEGEEKFYSCRTFILNDNCST